MVNSRAPPPLNDILHMYLYCIQYTQTYTVISPELRHIRSVWFGHMLHNHIKEVWPNPYYSTLWCVNTERYILAVNAPFMYMYNVCVCVMRRKLS